VVMQKTPMQKFTKIFIWIAAAALIAFLVFVTLTMLFGFISIFAGIIALGVGYGAYYLSTGMDIEYEYIVTNGTIDIDKIIGRRKRHRVLSAECKEIESFGKYQDSIMNGRYNVKLIAGNPNSDTAYYFTVRQKNEGLTLVVFEPNEKVLTFVKRYLPRQVYSDAFGRN
jgi:hypothetical protein